MADTRADLINQLAASMGAGQFASTTFEGSKYNPDTGTWWCNGMAITKSTADNAIQYFEMMEKKCGQEEAGRQMAMIYRCALESIKMMQNPKVINFLKEESKKGEL